ncbi:MAG TPA: alpha/beta hydrolase [Saprospiraceae bacterium]|nr:alpha/beta hydrolase [Saprospiraceae bacterium]
MDKEMRSEYLIIDGVRTHILRAGAGPLLLLIHGLGAPQMWQRVIEPLSRAFDVMVVSLPGFEESDCPPNLWSTRDCAVFLKTLIGKVADLPVNLVGISYGGQIVTTFATMFPEQLIKLVLIASTGLQPARWYTRSNVVWNSIAAVINYTVMRSTTALGILSRRSYYNISARPDDFVKKFAKTLSEREKRDAWLNALRNVLSPNSDFQARIASIPHPTLIVWGAQDRTVPVKYAHEFHSRIPHAKLEIISECGHSVPMEKPAELCEAIRNFVVQGADSIIAHEKES